MHQLRPRAVADPARRACTVSGIARRYARLRQWSRSTVAVAQGNPPDDTSGPHISRSAVAAGQPPNATGFGDHLIKAQ